MARKKQSLKSLISKTKIQASIEKQHQKLVESFEKQGIKLDERPIDEVEKDLLLSMQRLGMDLEETPLMRRFAEHHGILQQKK